MSIWSVLLEKFRRLELEVDHQQISDNNIYMSDNTIDPISLGGAFASKYDDLYLRKASYPSHQIFSVLAFRQNMFRARIGDVGFGIKERRASTDRETSL